MISSRIKNNIYALTSLAVIILTMLSFILITGFMVKMNNLVFNVNDNSQNTNDTSFDASSYNNIKDMLKKGG